MLLRLFLGLLLLLFLSCSKDDKKKKYSDSDIKQDSLSYLQLNVKDLDKAFNRLQNNPKTTEEQKAIISQFFDNNWKANDVSGGLLIGKNGQVIFEKYVGYANREKGDTLTADTPLHIASISKVLTATAVLKLIDENLIDLNEPVHNILTDFVYKDIRIIDLLTHRSGLPNYNYFPQNDSLWDMHKIQSNESMYKALNAKLTLPYSPPDQNFSYCNTNFALLALIIEKVTGMPYPKAMKYMLFEPLKMNHTFVFNIKDSANVSQSYSSRNTRWKFSFLDNIYGDKNIYSTPQDLFKFDKALYSDEFLSKEIKQKMKKGYSYEHKGIKNYGLGIRIKEYDNGETVWYHNGWWHGNYSSYTRAEKEHVAIIALGNKQLRSIYSAFTLVSIFGDYPLEVDNGGNEDNDSEKREGDTLQLKQDSVKVKEDNIKVKEKEEKDRDSLKSEIQ